MIQDIEPLRYDPVYRDRQPGEGGRVFCFWQDEVLLTEDDKIPSREQLEGMVERYQYLFAIDQEEYYLGTMAEKQTPPGTVWQPRFYFWALRPMDLSFAGYTAWHLEQWYEANRFCGHCGSALEHAENERMLRCPNCGNRVYPRLNPAVIVAVYDGDRLLMSRYATLPIRWYVLLAGFVEVGETVEQCVAREVFEETGLRVKNIQYYGSQPWGMSGNLTLAYTAELDGSDEITIDPSELSEARWFPRDQVPVNDEDQVSITQDMVRAFVAGRF